jgi:hypothetical protein
MRVIMEFLGIPHDAYEPIATVLSAALAVLGTWFAAVAARRGKQAKNSADRAADFSEPTGDGFAERVMEAFGRLEEKQDKTHDILISHLLDHSQAVNDSPAGVRIRRYPRP